MLFMCWVESHSPFYVRLADGHAKGINDTYHLFRWVLTRFVSPTFGIMWDSWRLKSKGQSTLNIETEPHSHWLMFVAWYHFLPWWRLSYINSSQYSTCWYHSLKPLCKGFTGSCNTTPLWIDITLRHQLQPASIPQVITKYPTISWQRLLKLFKSILQLP